jgi:aspartate aminotransferase
MNQPQLSEHFKNRAPSAIRLAHIEFMKRRDGAKQVNVAIGNVSLPMHPAMIRRMRNLTTPESPFRDGVVKYTATRGMEETREAFLNIIASSDFDTAGLHVQVTDGGSQTMELTILGVCGPAGSGKKPLLLIDPAYTNYGLLAARVGRTVISVQRKLLQNGTFELTDIADIERVVEKTRPGGIAVIPYDNPTGSFYDSIILQKIARICVKHNLWMVSDEAYRELLFTENETSSIWGLNEKIVPGITGRRISIETASKVWNACGLRIGALVTDNARFHEKSVAENTANLCPNAIGQYIFGSLAHESSSDLKEWYMRQRKYYRKVVSGVHEELKQRLPGVIVSNPEASIYSVIDVRDVVDENFEARDFVLYCAREGGVIIEDDVWTLLVAPMEGFYSTAQGEKNPGMTQMRIAYVEPPEKMRLVPELFSRLLKQYTKKISLKRYSVPVPAAAVSAPHPGSEAGDRTRDEIS